MRVLLVQPPSLGNYGLQSFMLTEPLGLELIAATIDSMCEVQILDMRIEHGLHKKLASFKPNAVGISACFTSDVYNTYQILDLVKEHNPSILTFVGGQHATMDYSNFTGKADIVVLGEGESTVPELLRYKESGKPLNEVNGLAFRHNGCWIESIPRPLINDLDKNPSPARSLVSKYLPFYFINSLPTVASVEIARGCPHRCKFCSVWRFYRNTYRFRSPRRIAQEIEQIESQYVLITDDSAFSNPSLMKDIAEEIGKAGIKKRYLMQVRADSAVNNLDIVEKWRDIGLGCVFVGFESINQPTLDELNKRLRVNHVEEAIYSLRNLGINIISSFIVNPDFNKEDFTVLRNFVGRMKLQSPVFSILTPLPGTVLYEERFHDITTHNYELYDLLHTALPTRMKLKEFYRQFALLYIKSYSIHLRPVGLLKPIFEKRFKIYLNQFLIWLKIVINNRPSTLVKHHQMPPGMLSMRRFHKQDQCMSSKLNQVKPSKLPTIAL